MLQAVPALFLGLECQEGGKEVGGGEPGLGPPREVGAGSFQVGSIVREGGGEGIKRIDDLNYPGSCFRVVCGVRNGAVLDLEAWMAVAAAFSRSQSWFSAEIPVTAVVRVSVIVGCLSGCLLTMASVASNQQG